MKRLLLVLILSVCMILPLTGCSESGGGTSSGEKVLRTITYSNSRTDLYYNSDGSVRRSVTVYLYGDGENNTPETYETVTFAEDGTVASYEYTNIPQTDIRIEGNRVITPGFTVEYNKNGMTEYISISGAMENLITFNDKGLPDTSAQKTYYGGVETESTYKYTYLYDENGYPYISYQTDEDGNRTGDSYQFYIYGPAE